MKELLIAKLKAAALSQLTLHTAQALAGVVTFTGVDLHGMSIESWSQVTAGALMQTAVWLVSKYVLKVKTATP